MTQKPVWDASNKVLSGTSLVPKDEDYNIIFAANGREPGKMNVSEGEVNWNWIDKDNGIFEMIITSSISSEINWEIAF